ncbi:rho guanine nucleotide exchange factor 12-like isoform X2 [Clupea harengus]|uniref:Rho guanine nucleotide exchange factor 12 n=1 Tax=Clupea harengus TaxID=7950 RepID=A0A8M1K8C9_CLUHA|nr:rho guanine nucleotide exchange factor 12-like isoform X2 [Clupea harengus]
MSDTQSTITDRFPKKANRSSSILSKDHPPDKKPKSDRGSLSPPHEFDPTDVQLQRKAGSEVLETRPESCGLVQRCVIIQKDENGFGLTVSGDNPVFVQLVKQDGAAMRAGVQTGDRIIKVNGTLVTHSNHVEVVKLIKSGSYVALTVLGRPPGLPQIPLNEGDAELSSPLSTLLSAHTQPPSSPLHAWEENSGSQKVDILQRMLSKEQQELQAWREEYLRHPTPKLQRDIQEAQKHIPHLQDQISKAIAATQDVLCLGDGDERGVVEWDQSSSSTEGVWSGHNYRPFSSPDGAGPRDGSYPSSRSSAPTDSPRSAPRNSLTSWMSPEPDTEENTDLDPHAAVGSPSSRLGPQIIGAEDDYFDSEPDQVNGQCSCFQSIELLKSRPAHLAAFLHHVVSQFDPAPLLCYLYAELYKNTNSKETRRVFMDFLNIFIDRAANLKVPLPESISSELEKRRLELIPEELHRQYIQQMQEKLLPDIQRHLEDFRQKRSMGLTVAEGELMRLDTERLRDRVALERERTCAENIISKIEEVLLTSQPPEEEKSSTMQYVIFSYMKHLGVRVKEQRNLESKRVRINFLPKIKKSTKPPEKEGEEKVKKTRFPSILGPQRRLSRNDTTSIGRAMDQSKQRPQKQLSQPVMGVSEPLDGGRLRGSQSSEGSELTYPTGLSGSPLYSPPTASYDPSARDSDSGMSPLSGASRLSEGLLSEGMDGPQSPSSGLDLSPSNLEQLPEEDRDSDRFLEGGTPKMLRRLGVVGSAETQSEDDQGSEMDSDLDRPNWQHQVGREVLAGLTPHQIKRQEVINELFHTERTHVQKLKVLDSVFCQKITRDNILPPADIKSIFTNLEDIIQLHVSISDQMTSIRKRNDTPVVDQIGDDLLAWFGDCEEERVKQAVATFCSNQPFALELIKTKQKKDTRFSAFMQEAERDRLCRRLQLKDIIPAEMQRVTKYPLLLDDISKYTEEAEEKEKVKSAADCCRRILNYVNQAVKEAENKQRLEDYQRRLDLSSLKQSENPMISEFKNLDLTKKTMVYEGPLSWKVNKDKTIELYTLLLEDILVLLQKQDDRLVLKCHSKNLAGTADTKHIFSPVIKLSTVMVRSVATDNKSFFVLSMSDNGAQIYELMAQTVSKQRTWQRQISQRAEAMKVKPHSVIPLPQPDERDGVELISSGVSKLGKDSDRLSSGSIHSTGTMKADEDDDVIPEEGPFLDAEGADGIAFLQPHHQGGATDGRDLEPYRAEEALKTLASLKQVLLAQLMTQEESSRGGRGSGNRLLRTTSLRTPAVDSPSRATLENGSGREAEARADRGGPQDLASGDTGFFEAAEDYAGYLVLEGFGGSRESSTDDELAVGVGAGAKGLALSRGCVGDSGISLRCPSGYPTGSISTFSRQVFTHLRNLQASLNQLKDMETKYFSLLRQRQADPAMDSEEGKDKR